MIFMSEGNMFGWQSCLNIALVDNYIAMLFIANGEQAIYWNADGFFDREPANHK